MLVIGININFSSVLVNVLLKLGITVLFPLILWLIPFFKTDEKQWVVGGFNRIMHLLNR
jgi:hypothetical protein